MNVLLLKAFICMMPTIKVLSVASRPPILCSVTDSSHSPTLYRSMIIAKVRAVPVTLLGSFKYPSTFWMFSACSDVYGPMGSPAHLVMKLDTSFPV